MSISYSISIILNLEHTKKNIEHIFQQCIENNMYLYADPFDKLSELDSANAAVRILTFELEDDERNIFVRFQDTDFFMWIYNKNNLINLSIGAFGILWRKEFMSGYYGFDFARYIRVLLRVCSDFTILSLETDAI